MNIVIKLVSIFLLTLSLQLPANSQVEIEILPEGEISPDDGTSSGSGISFGGGNATCVFRGRVPVKKFNITNSSVQVNIEAMTADLLSDFFEDNENSTLILSINGKLLGNLVISKLSDLVGKKVKLQGDHFSFELSQLNKETNINTTVSNKSGDGTFFPSKGNALVKKVTEEKISSSFKITFKDTVQTISEPGENDISTQNKKVSLKCIFNNLPIFVQ